MSNQSPFAGRTAQAFPTLPKGDVLGTYDSYPDAQRVVAKLAEADFPVNQLSIVGNDLKTVERVTGKMTYGRAAIAGALSGLWLGIFFGIVLTLFSPSAGGLILAAAIIGAAFGMLYGIASFAITKRQRDFTSVHQVLATNYQIVVAPQLTGQARQILGEAGVAPQTHWNPGTPGAPGAPGAGFQGQPPQQPWRPGPQNGQPNPPAHSPYGGHATPHQQPGDTQQPGTSAPGAQTGAPRYGTNDGPRYGERPTAAPAPAGAERAQQPRHDEPPRYGERVTGGTPGAAPSGGDPASSDRSSTGPSSSDGSSSDGATDAAPDDRSR